MKIENQPTLKIALRPKVADAESEDAESVQLAEDILLEREQRGQSVQLGVQSLPMSLAGIRFCHPILLRWFQAVRSKRDAVYLYNILSKILDDKFQDIF